KKFLPIFLPYSFFKAIYLIKKNKIEYLHLSDALLSPIGFWLKELTGVLVSTNVHGLDLTFDSNLYQTIIPFYLKKIDLIICNSRATKQECLKRGVDPKKCAIIPCGVNPEEFRVENQNKVRKNTRALLSKQLSLNLEDKKILLTVGRLVKRKGHQWFIANVMPKLPKDTIYLIAGDGEEKENIAQTITKLGLEKRVFLLGRISDDLKKDLYNSSDLFIMPNINIKGDMEGFGIVAIEAGSAGLETIASNTEGIRDAIINGKTGWLVKTGNTEAFVEKINNEKLSEKTVRETVLKNFSWDEIAQRYKKKLLI
ncbi:MAG: glycosyltransferase family 4 protein, partial [Candidatus Pacebacteria bacterium]|nr:glycosyltransferase family 4 protein [Candidatus Paceibacterota bacterium]